MLAAISLDLHVVDKPLAPDLGGSELPEPGLEAECLSRYAEGFGGLWDRSHMRTVRPRMRLVNPYVTL